MARFRGFDVAIQYDSETSFGAGATPDTAIGKVTTFTPTIANNFFREQGLGEGRNQTVTLFGNFDANGTIEWEVDDFTFLQYAVGPITGAGTGASPFILTEADCIGYTAAEMLTFGMEVGATDCSATDDVDTYSGVSLNNVTITAAVDDILRASADWVAKTVVSSTAASAFTASTVDPWVFMQGTFSWNSVATSIQSFAITIANNLFIYRDYGDRFIQKQEPGVRRYDWTIVLKMDSAIFTTLRDDFYGQANSPSTGVASASPTDRILTLVLSDGADRNATIQLSGGAIESIGKPVDLGGGLVEATFTGFSKQGTGAVPLTWQTTA